MRLTLQPHHVGETHPPTRLRGGDTARLILCSENVRVKTEESGKLKGAALWETLSGPSVDPIPPEQNFTRAPGHRLPVERSGQRG